MSTNKEDYDFFKDQLDRILKKPHQDDELGGPIRMVFKNIFVAALMVSPLEVMETISAYKSWTIKLANTGHGEVISPASIAVAERIDKFSERGAYTGQMINYANWIATAILIAGNAGLAKATFNQAMYERAIKSARSFDEKMGIIHVVEWVRNI